jgi:acyl transferase domain-containing protein/3-hydroxymyristoyl/3-hydroxydecanoyl-(acyl carrier protein) dehydratase
MSRSEKIAIVGIGGIFPGSSTLDGFWNNVVNGVDCSKEIPEERWPVDPKKFYDPEVGTLDKVPNLRGYFMDKLSNDFYGLDIDIDAVDQLDELFKLVLLAGRDAFYDCKHEAIDRKRTKIIIGNIALPTTHSVKMARELIGATYAKSSANLDVEELNLEAADHYVCGLPASLLAKSLGLGLGSFTLDAACASTLYSFHLAVRDLITGDADCVIAGGVSKPDCMYTQMGFGQLRAVSPTGTCNPFDESGRGLMVGEGGGFFTLKRLSDAKAHGDRIYGTICGTGVSNDQFGSLLAPDSKGQVRALKSAYTAAGWTPDMVDMIECHATGTPLGDKVEVESLKQLFGKKQKDQVILGSVKANVGHMLTAAGASGMMKVLLSLKHKRFAPTANHINPIPSLEGSPFKVLNKTEEWGERADGAPRRAGLSGFGFGGINAHVLIEEYRESNTLTVDYAPKTNKVAIIGTAQMLGQDESQPSWWGFENTKIFKQKFAGNLPKFKQFKDLDIPLGHFKIPPVEMKTMSPQQLLMLFTAEKALKDAYGTIEPSENTGVFIGIGLESSVNLLTCRWQFDVMVDEWCEKLGVAISAEDRTEWIEGLKANFGRELTTDSTMGNLGGIVASRVAREFGFGGPSYALSNEEHSGTDAFQLGFKAIQRGELNSAIVGAVDFNCELQAAISNYLIRHNAGEAQPEYIQDGSVALVLKNYDQAIKDGNKIIAIVNDPTDVNENRIDVSWSYEDDKNNTYLGAAGALAAVRESALGMQNRQIPFKSEYWIRNRGVGPRAAVIRGYKASHNFGLVGSSVYLQEAPVNKDNKVQSRFQAASLPEYEAKDFGKKPQVAFLYPGAGNYYQDMGKQLTNAFPDVMEKQDRKHLYLKDQFAVKSYWNTQLGQQIPFMDVLAGQCALGCFATDIFTEFGIKPDAIIGYSLGESAGAFASGAWRGRDALYRKLEVSPLFNTEIDGRMDAVRRMWKLGPDEKIDWVTALIQKPVVEIESALEGLERAYLGNINTDNEAIVCGDRTQVNRLLKTLDYPLISIPNLPAVHSPAVAECEEMYHEFHKVPVKAQEGLRIYSGAKGEAIEVTTDGIADSILAHGIHGVNFPKVIRKAYDDGVRIFVEMGPGSSLTRMVKEILKGHEFEAISICEKADLEVSNLRNCLGMLKSYDLKLKTKNYIERAGALGSGETKQKIKSFKVEVGGAPMSKVPQLPNTQSPVAEPAAPTAPAPAAYAHPAYDVPPAPIMAAQIPTPAAPNAQEPAAPSPQQMAGAMQEIAPTSSMLNDPQMMQALMATHTFSTSAQIAQMKLNTQLTLSMQELLSTFYTSSNADFASAQADFNSIMPPMPPMEPQPAFVDPYFAPAAQPQQPIYEEAPAPVRARTLPAVPVLESKKRLPRGMDKNRDAMAWLGYDKCMEYANGVIGKVLGADFAEVDSYPTRVRLPDGPLMLCHRIMDVTGDAKSMTSGTLETEHDVVKGAWYLDDGYIPTCIAVEAGQADLFLSGWLGADFHTKGKACYRLLDANVKFHDDLPAVGSTINYKIYIREFFFQGETLLFRFGFEATSNGKRFITMEDGCAGFFTEEDLALGKGIVRTTMDLKHKPGKYTGDFKALTQMAEETYNGAQLDMLRKGDYVSCFGPQFNGLQLTNPKSLPGLEQEKLNLVDRITKLDPNGGRFGIGTITGEADIHPDDWFLTCHFVDDQVMPGTLMFECAQHTLRVYMMRMGWVGETEDIRCQPKPGLYSRLKCRGQVRADAKKVQYEIEIKEIGYGEGGAYCIADALMYVDGRPIVEIGNMSLEFKGLSKERVEHIWATRIDKPFTEVKAPIYTYEQICAFSSGKPSDAFGDKYKIFDGDDRKIARLPRDPYQFLDRVTDVQAEAWKMEKGGVIEAQYDVPPDAWYFKDAGANGEMPFAVLLEAALQPCGWFSGYMGSALTVDVDVKYRNLGGTARMVRPVTPSTGVLTTKVTCTSVSLSAGMIIQTFDFVLSSKEGVVYDGNTMFGFFSKEALANQVGITDTDLPEQVIRAQKDKKFDITTPYPQSDALPTGNMVMLDAMTKEGEDILMGQKAVERSEWFFDAHFYEDPVMPGSLGLEAVLQLCYAEAARIFGVDKKYIALANEGEHEWVYRGQVTPEKDQIQTVAQVVSVDHDRQRLVANGFLLRDGLLVYRMHNFVIEVK